MNSKMKWIWLFATAILGSVAMVQFSGQPQRMHQAIASRPLFLVICIDVSNSGSEEDKRRYGRQAMSLIQMLDPSSDRLLILRFDRNATEIGSEIPLDVDTYTFVLRDAILRPSETTMTRQPVLLDHIVESLNRFDLSRYDVRLHLLTDGGNEDASPAMESLYAKSVTKLSAIQELSGVFFWDVRDGLREGLRRRFREMDVQGRLHIAGPEEDLR